MKKLFYLTTLFCLISLRICFSQNIIIHQEDSGLVNESYLNDTLITKGKPLLEDALKIMSLLKDKKYKEIQEEFKHTFSNTAYTLEEIKEKTNWASALINKYGILETSKIKFVCSVPIEWYLKDKREFDGKEISYSLSFKFEYPDDSVKDAKNVISISYSNHSLPIIQIPFGRLSVAFDDAKEHMSIQDLIDNAAVPEEKK